MERIKTLYNRLNVFGALLVSTLLPCFLATLLLAAVFLPMMNRTARSSDSAYARVLLDAGANQFERIGESIAEATAVVEYSTWIHPLYLDMLEGTRPDYTVKKTITDALNQACSRGEFKSFSFRFYDDGALYNNRTVVDDAAFYERSQFDYIQYHFFALQTPEPTVSTITYDGIEYLLYQAPFRDIPGGRYKGEINILIQSSVLGSRLLHATDADAAAFRLTDRDGRCLWSYQTGIYSEPTVTLSRQTFSGRFMCCVDVPLSVHDQTRARVLPAMLATLAVSLLLSAAICYLLTCAAYRPFGKIIGKFVGREPRVSNDFVALERVFDRILQEKSRVETSLDQLRPIAQQKILGSLLAGTANLSDSLEDQLADVRLHFDHALFTVIALEAPFSQMETADVNLATELALQTLLEHLSFGLELKAYLYSEDTDHFRILVNHGGMEELEAFLSALAQNCMSHFRRYTQGEGLYLGVGRSVPGMEEIYHSAEQAETATHAAAMNRQEQPMFYSEIEPELSYDYYYPISEEVLLARAITGCSADGAKAILAAVLEENARRTKLSPKSMWLLYMDLSATVARSGQSLGIAQQPIDLRQEFITLEQIRARAEAQIEGICTQVLRNRQKTMNGAETEILRYIDEHICDADLSLNSIAERFGKSSAYISVLFKEQRGVNYNTYVNQTRILRAVHLINEEKLDVATVYPMVGYVSLSTFRRNYARYARGDPCIAAEGKGLTKE